ncbi:MAG TPA: gamma-glutamyl-gamma-aminobutyrate hydrolase family protein [Candidatus Sulfotelmatobacter sp.]|nr:gamma-glutamyl-gamma-aminobutyrate hydrolase family protein [Candidatus Sulfotelmatobacter sp.]
MPPRIAIPRPHSTDREYSERAIPQYERAVSLAGGEPVRIPFDLTPAALRSLAESCHGVLLPGSKADIDPMRFRQEKSAHTAAADLRREEVDDFLLEHAYAQGKPVLGICYGLQSMNVFRGGSLIQHIPEFLPKETRTKVNHRAGRSVAVAHTVSINPSSKLAQIVGDHQNREGHGLSRADESRERGGALAPEGNALVVPVNSSHHQSAGTIGEGLLIVARCPNDGIIEALEGTLPDHFVLAVQWHPERSIGEEESSRSLFRALIQESQVRRG